jgi:class 3 adenylate cyclase
MILQRTSRRYSGTSGPRARAARFRCPKGLRLGNDAIKLDAVVLYADMADSTALVDTNKAAFAAEVYKSYLTCAAKIIKKQDGAVTAYDGTWTQMKNKRIYASAWKWTPD